MCFSTKIHHCCKIHWKLLLTIQKNYNKHNDVHIIVFWRPKINTYFKSKPIKGFLCLRSINITLSIVKLNKQLQWKIQRNCIQTSPASLYLSSRVRLFLIFCFYQRLDNTVFVVFQFFDPVDRNKTDAAKSLSDSPR